MIVIVSFPYSYPHSYTSISTGLVPVPSIYATISETSELIGREVNCTENLSSTEGRQNALQVSPNGSNDNDWL